MEKGKKRNIIFVLVLSIMLFAGSVAGLILMSMREAVLPENTTELSATLVETKRKEPGKDGVFVVYTVEYEGELLIADENAIDNRTAFTKLQAGEIVFFRIENVWLNRFEEASSTYIVSLRTEKRDIMSLENYNALAEYQNSRITRTCMVFGPVFLLSAVYRVLLLKGIDVFRRFKRKDENLD